MSSYRGLDQLRYDKFANHPELKTNSEEFKKLEYRLKVNLGNVDIQAKKIWNVTSPKLTKKYFDFKDEHDFSIEMNSMVQTEDQDEINSIEKVLERGFVVQPPGGLLFPCGYFPLKKVDGLIYEAIICKVSVSKIVSTKNSEINPDVIRELHRENIYDSILCHEDSKKQGNQIPYNYNMIVLKGGQILPEYVIHFDITEKKKNICKVCEEKDATIYCKNDQIDLCKSCDINMHPNDMPTTRNHVRIGINDKPIEFTNCEIHPNNPLDQFCINCRREICISCKLVGDHFEDEKSKHTVWPINDCFNNLRDTKDNFTPKIKQMKNKINSTQLNLASKSINLKESFNNAEQKIKQIYDNAVKRLRTFASNTQAKITSNEIALRKYLDELIWMDYFMRYQVDYIEPQKVIKNFFLHQIIQGDIINSVVLPSDEEINITADFDVVGDIHIKSKNNDLSDEENSLEKTSPPKKSNVKDETDDKRVAFLESFNKINEMGALQTEGGNNLEKNYNDAAVNINKLLQDFLLTNKKLRENVEVSFNSKDYNKHSLVESANKTWLSLTNQLEAPEYIEKQMDRVFVDSQIINNDMAKLIYCNCQKGDTLSLPEPKLFSMFKKDNMPSSKDFIKSFDEIKHPSLILFKQNEKIFGAYATQSWFHLEEDTFGDNNCFQFNLNEDCKQLANVEKKKNPKGKTGPPVYQWKRQDGLGFGATDLVYLQSGQWMSEIETTYMKAGYQSKKMESAERKNFLAGEYKFVPDVIEIWQLLY